MIHFQEFRQPCALTAQKDIALRGEHFAQGASQSKGKAARSFSLSVSLSSLFVAFLFAHQQI